MQLFCHLLTAVMISSSSAGWIKKLKRPHVLPMSGLINTTFPSHHLCALPSCDTAAVQYHDYRHSTLTHSKSRTAHNTMSITHTSRSFSPSFIFLLLLLLLLLLSGGKFGPSDHNRRPFMAIKAQVEYPQRQHNSKPGHWPLLSSRSVAVKRLRVSPTNWRFLQSPQSSECERRALDNPPPPFSNHHLAASSARGGRGGGRPTCTSVPPPSYEKLCHQ